METGERGQIRDTCLRSTRLQKLRGNRRQWHKRNYEKDNKYYVMDRYVRQFYGHL